MDANILTAWRLKTAMLSIIKSKYSTTVLFSFVHFSKVYRHGFKMDFGQDYNQLSTRETQSSMCDGREMIFPDYRQDEWRYGSLLPFTS